MAEDNCNIKLECCTEGVSLAPIPNLPKQYSAAFTATDSCGEESEDPVLSYTGYATSLISQEDADYKAEQFAVTMVTQMRVEHPCNIPPTPPPLFVATCEDVSGWPTEVDGVPYENIGDNTDGFVDLFGDGLPIVVASELTYDFPANADPDPFSGTLVRTGFQLPVAAQDFEFEAEFKVDGGNYSYTLRLMFFADGDNALTFGGGAFLVTTGGLQAELFCNRNQDESNGDLPFDPALPTGGLLNDTSWHTLKLTRVGTLFELFLDTVSYGTWDCESLIVGNLGISLDRRTWDSDTPTFYLRNISVT